VAFHAFAVTAPGLEELAADEIGLLGITSTTIEKGGVAFDADAAVVARALINVRTIGRILVRVAQFRAVTFAELERNAQRVRWTDWIADGGGVRLRVTCRKSRLYHSDAVAERIAREILDAVPHTSIAALGPPQDDTDGGITEADVQGVVVRILENECTISFDASGAPLHMRGYRLATAKAPLRETLAAAMLVGAGYDGATPVCDPMCGSGTIPIEAAFIARGIAPGIQRTFAMERWPNVRRSVWDSARAEARARVLPHAGVAIMGSDRDQGAVQAAGANAARAGVDADIRFRVDAISAIAPTDGPGLLVVNPPYGHRVGDASTLRDLYARLGQVARTRFAGWRFALLSGDRTQGHALERQLGIGLGARWRSVNGGIPVRLLVGDIPG
jgi:putative N6-adenine-specific DNA methylase